MHLPWYPANMKACLLLTLGHVTTPHGLLVSQAQPVNGRPLLLALHTEAKLDAALPGEVKVMALAASCSTLSESCSWLLIKLCL